MKKSFDKKQIIYYLFGLSVLFLIANLVQVKMSKKETTPHLIKMPPDAVNMSFLDNLKDFGLKKEWIEPVKKRRNFSGKYNYRVDVPKDLPITVILQEIYGTFYGKGINLSTKELVIGGKTFLKISFDDEVILTSEFNYDDKIERDAGSAGIIVSGFGDAGTEIRDELASGPQMFAALLVPSKQSVKLSKEFTNGRKEFAVLLNDDISDLNFKMSPGYSSGRLRNSIRAIIAAFPKAVFFMIDNRSSLYTSPVFPFIRDEFKKRNISLLKESSVVKLGGADAAQINKDFRKLIITLKDGQQKLINVNVDDFKIIRPEILGLIKVGYKFINPSVVLKNKSDLYIKGVK